MSTHATTHSYSIKEASDLTGLPASTLRYYETIGIISPISRDPSSKQRVYDDQDLDTLTAVACLHATGMPIADMREYISNSRHGADNAPEQIGLLARQQRLLADEARLMAVRQHYVDLKIAYWKAVQAGNAAEVERISRLARELVDALK